MDSAAGGRALSGAGLNSSRPLVDPKALICDRALALGFDAVGFVAPNWAERHARDWPNFSLRDSTGTWAGSHLDRTHAAIRATCGLTPAAWSHSACLYAPDDDPLASLALADRGTISVYARNRDYHDVVKGMLKHLAQFIVARLGPAVKVFVDTAPVMEKPLAERAGIGWQGKHTNLVSRTHGSWLFLGEIYTTLDITPDEPHADRCGSCTRCLDVCPTNAFPAPYRLDATRCISYLTIEHHGPIPRELRPLMGNRIYGCDDCLAVCPWNRFASTTPHDKLRARAELTAPRLADLAALDDTGFRTMFIGSPIKRIGRDRFVRNVLIAIGNSGDIDLGQAAARLSNDANPVVAEAAAWACERLQSGASAGPRRPNSPAVR